METHIRKWYTVLSLALIILSVLFYDTHLTIKIEFEEDRIIENITACIFFIVFLLSLIFLLKYRNIKFKNTLILIMVLGLAGFLDELSFGQRIFNFKVPEILGFPLDAIHDLVAISILAIKKYLYLQIIILIILIILIIISYYLIRKKIISVTNISKSILLINPYFFLAFFALYVSIAIAIEEIFRGFNLRTLDIFLHPLEEVLELNAALALLFCCLSIRYSQKWLWVSSALIVSTAIVTALVPTHTALWKVYDREGLRAYQRGEFGEVKKQYLAAIREAEKIGPQDYRLALSLHYLAGLYNSQKKFAEAESLYKRSLSIREKSLGQENLDVATSLSSLAGVYVLQGRGAEAEPLFRRALVIREKALGPEHAKVAKILVKLTVFYVSLRKYAEAEPLYKRLLAIREKSLGQEHPLVTTNRYNLFQIYQAQGKYAEALKELEPLAKKGDAKAQYSLAVMYLDGRGVSRDYVRSYKWLNLSGLSLPPGRIRAKSANLLDRVSKQMTPAQIAEAMKLVREWHAKHKNK